MLFRRIPPASWSKKLFLAQLPQPSKRGIHVQDQDNIGHNHIVQLGDPVLRRPVLPLDPSEVGHPIFQALVDRLVATLNKYDCLGLSAPQIGVSAPISVVQFTAHQLQNWDKDYVERFGLVEVPLTVLINPEMRVTDAVEVFAREGCASMQGFSAVVPRAREIHVKALNRAGEPFEFGAKNWTARMIQHELDHLRGKLFLDRMRPESLVFNHWRIVNKRGGKYTMSYSGPKKRIHAFWNLFNRQETK
ncbi:peptide deformylase, mitochondrial-like [Tigriopus californicus]|uniref:peptide deformylase, mitochondrial-like n=1 Tax=Tigriopus californicus TaxID=6832 RepID=UPI0027DA94AC|nr:peptide deformylase, mitochondrial-like [Tigriopus californicus]XP_059087811.1 peptide deformylase, mitochondrial-like [Tigriopus californicus]